MTAYVNYEFEAYFALQKSREYLQTLCVLVNAMKWRFMVATRYRQIDTKIPSKVWK